MKETDNKDLFDQAYQIMIDRIKDKFAHDEPYYFETTRGKKHEAIAIDSNDIIRIKRTEAPKIPEYNINKKTLKDAFNHFRFRDTITIKQYDTFVRETLKRGANHGPTYIAIIRALQRISRGL